MERPHPLGPSHQSQACLTNPIPITPIFQTSHTHPRPSRSVLIPANPPKAIHTHSNPSPHIQCPPYPSKPSIPIPQLNPFSLISDCPHPTKALYTHTRPSIPTLGPHAIPWPFTPPTRTPIPTLSHSSENLHTHQSLQYISQGFNAHQRPYPSQVLITHLRPFTPIPGPSHLPKALHTNLRTYTLISGPPHPPKALHTHLRNPIALSCSPPNTLP